MSRDDQAGPVERRYLTEWERRLLVEVRRLNVSPGYLARALVGLLDAGGAVVRARKTAHKPGGQAAWQRASGRAGTACETFARWSTRRGAEPGGDPTLADAMRSVGAMAFVLDADHLAALVSYAFAARARRPWPDTPSLAWVLTQALDAVNGRYDHAHPWRYIPTDGERLYTEGDCPCCHYERGALPATRTVEWTDEGGWHQETERCPWNCCPSLADNGDPYPE